MYNIDYFIKKFEAIPEDQWTTDTFKRLRYNANTNSNYWACCANGHCGVELGIQKDGKSEEAIALFQVFSDLPLTSTKHNTELIDNSVECIERFGKDYSNKAATINNGETKEYQQDTPKQRILAALNDIKLQEEALKDVNSIIQTASKLETVK